MSMRSGYLRVAMAAVFTAAILGTVGSAYAQNEVQPEQVHVDLNLKDADMIAATKILTAQTGVAFIFEPSSEPYAKVTLSLHGVTADDAIAYICKAAGASFRKDENGVYIIGHKKADVATDATTTPAPPPISPGHIHKFKLMHADASQVFAQITGKGPVDASEAFKFMNDFDSMVNPTRRSQFQKPEIYMLGNAAGTVFQPVNSQTYATPRTMSESGSNIQIPGENAGQVGGEGGGFGGGFGGGQFGGGGGGQFGGGGAGQLGGQGGQGAQGGRGLQTGGLIPRDIQYITFDPTDNTIIVNATDEQIRQIQDAITFFDVAPRQVMIKVEFITTSTGTTSALGFDFTYARGQVFAGVAPGTFANTGNPVFLNFASGNIAGRLRALLSRDQGKTVNAPVIRTMNNQPAQVQQSVQTTVFVDQVVSIGNGNVITQSVPQTLTINTVLSVRPRINDDGTVTVFLNPTIQDFGALVKGPQGQEIPNVNTQALAVVARVRSGDTVALAGFTRKSEQGSSARFPILGDLPIIGQFFRSNSRQLTNSELLIFVTPTVLEDEENGGLNP